MMLLVLLYAPYLRLRVEVYELVYVQVVRFADGVCCAGRRGG